MKLPTLKMVGVSSIRDGVHATSPSGYRSAGIVYICRMRINILGIRGDGVGDRWVRERSIGAMSVVRLF